MERDDVERVFREDGTRLWRAVLAYAGGRSDVATEAVAEAFARALEHRERIRKPVPWIYRTAIRVASEELRRGRRSGALVETAGDDGLGDLGELMKALRRLSPNQRAAVVLHYEEGFKVREVAALLGMSSATVKVHLHRGRKRLRELLGSEEAGDA